MQQAAIQKSETATFNNKVTIKSVQIYKKIINFVDNGVLRKKHTINFICKTNWTYKTQKQQRSGGRSIGSQDNANWLDYWLDWRCPARGRFVQMSRRATDVALLFL